MALDGLIVSLSGSYQGEVNDNRIFKESGIIDRLRTVSFYCYI